MASLTGKTVLVTGASAGIGRAAVKAFVAAGSKVIAVARSRERLDELARESAGVVALPTDLTDAAAAEALARTILDRYGPPDVIVANAGRGVDARFTETTDAAFQSLFELNVLGVVRSVRPFLPAMIARGSGRILFISSVVGKRGVPSYTAYSASKYAIHGIADALRPELWGTGVTVGIVCPSSTETEFDERKLRAGPPQRSVRVQRHSAESVARSIVRMARTTRREMVLSPEGKLMTIVNTLSPKFMDWVLAKALVKKG